MGERVSKERSESHAWDVLTVIINLKDCELEKLEYSFFPSYHHHVTGSKLSQPFL